MLDEPELKAYIYQSKILWKRSSKF